MRFYVHIHFSLSICKQYMKAHLKKCAFNQKPGCVNKAFSKNYIFFNVRTFAGRCLKSSNISQTTNSIVPIIWNVDTTKQKKCLHQLFFAIAMYLL